jgi:hypothetical protein
LIPTIGRRRFLLANFNTSPNPSIPNHRLSAIEDVSCKTSTLHQNLSILDHRPWVISNVNSLKFYTLPNLSIPDHRPSTIFVGELKHLEILAKFLNETGPSLYLIFKPPKGISSVDLLTL